MDACSEYDSTSFPLDTGATDTADANASDTLDPWGASDAIDGSDAEDSSDG